MARPQLTVLIPCLDEEPNLRRLEDALFPVLDGLGFESEVLFIDDGSSDGTAEAVEQLSQRRPETRLVSHDRTRGIGASLKTGLEHAAGDQLVFLDADLTFHPRLISALIDSMDETGADLVSGSPVLGGMPGVPLARRLPSLALNAFYRGLFDHSLTSYTPMFRLYQVTDLREIDIVSDGFEVSVEVLILLLRSGKRAAEVPAPLSLRQGGESKLRRWRELRAHMSLAWRLLRGS